MLVNVAALSTEEGLNVTESFVLGFLFVHLGTLLFFCALLY